MAGLGFLSPVTGYRHRVRWRQPVGHVSVLAIGLDQVWGLGCSLAMQSIRFAISQT